MSSELPVVRIYATTQRPDYDAPWQSCTPSNSTGSGVVIAPGRVLTAAHVVADATFLQVQRVSDPVKWVARVEAVSHDCDLALVAVSEPEFMTGLEPASLGELPELRDKVSVIGYPVGGEEVSITEGVVSRIEVQRYTHSSRNLLAVTVDAAINNGNSGGPVYKDDRVMGIAFQSHREGENIGDVVPVTLIRRFLAAADGGKDPRIPGLGIRTQNLENPRLRAQIGLRGEQSGILVVGVAHGGTGDGVVEVGDAIVAIDGQRISNNRTVRYRGRFRTLYNVEIGHRYIGDSVRFTVLRDGETRELEATLQAEPYLVARNQYDVTPSYFVFAGFVFQRLSRDFLSTWDEWWNRAPSEFLVAYHGGLPTPERRELVVIAQVLADEINVGYAHFFSESVLSVNGAQPTDFADFVRRIDAATAPGATAPIELVTSHRGRVVLDPAEARQATPRILTRYDIHSDRSADLQAETTNAGGANAAE